MQDTLHSSRVPVILAASLLLLSCSRGGLSSITSRDLSGYVSALASDELAGRLTGSPQIARAEEYISRTFREAGLLPLPGRTDYFYDYIAWRAGYDTGATALTVRRQGAPVAVGRLGVDFRPFDFSSSGSVAAEVVFAGYGITAPEYGYDDYRGIDVRGRLVLIFRYEPNENDPQSPFAGARHTGHATFAGKARNARAHGAAGMLLFTTPLSHGPDEDLRGGSAYPLKPEELAAVGETTDGKGFLALQVSQGLADEMARSAGTTIRELQSAVDGGATPAELGVRGLFATASVARSARPEPVQARDVVGYLKGKKSDEVVVVGGHHDHIGAFTSTDLGSSASGADTVYNGADDNASGVAAVLELAQAFGRQRRRLERSMVFVTFSGEEQYLLGSSALLASGLLPATTVPFMLNLDMIGRNPDGELLVYGAAGDPGLRAAVEQANAGIGLRLSFPPQMGDSFDSDQSIFQAHGIPSLFLHTGLHDDYHGLDDEADRLDYERMRLVTRLAYEVLLAKANQSSAAGSE
jgi:hypothetical protein